MTATITIRIPNEKNDLVTVRAWLTLTPGLVVNESIGDPGWVVTHQRSGLLIALTDDPESAQAIAAELGTLADWTLSGFDLKKLGIRASVDAVIRRTIPVRTRYGEAIDRNVVA